MGDDQYEPDRRQPFVKLFYSPDYVRSGHAFETTRKSQWIADSLRRERLVFDWCRRRGIPIAFVLAGGYLGPGLDESGLVALHRLTLSAAVRAGKG